MTKGKKQKRSDVATSEGAGNVLQNVEVALAIIKTIDVLVKGYEFRKDIDAIVAAIETDHQLRMAEVQKIVDIYKTYREDMSQDVRDKYHLAILKLLDVTHLKLGLLEKINTRD